MKAPEQKVVESIERQWNGGEHRLAGARASELIFGAGKQPNERLQTEVVERIPGIERYLAAPAEGHIVEKVPEQSGDPMARQPENRAEATGESNQSTPKAKDEQKAIDNKLAPGRKARAKAAKRDAAKADDKNGGAGELVSTKLNPDPQNPTAA
ncbi:hypothetical protein [Rhizobium sp. BK661]|uniref:hypothetical protein n=1 Tax=Rhizobium sp. BK661 TaxID=2586991 RepID=UPI00216A8A0D|nr:hypothetical protein [Rhizobium sp. BK661]MCS3741983.1 hypothetical protein [Rhizobium sp. BK661]